VVQEARAQIRWRCKHLYPALVTVVEKGGRCARCLRCGMQGPPRAGLAEAMQALRGAARR
jgi:hypothetical protein